VPSVIPKHTLSAMLARIEAEFFIVILLFIFGSSVKCVGKFWLGQFPKEN